MWCQQEVGCGQEKSCNPIMLLLALWLFVEHLRSCISHPSYITHPPAGTHPAGHRAGSGQGDAPGGLQRAGATAVAACPCSPLSGRTRSVLPACCGSEAEECYTARGRSPVAVANRRGWSMHPPPAFTCLPQAVPSSQKKILVLGPDLHPVQVSTSI